MLYKIPGARWASVTIRNIYDWMGTFVNSPFGDSILAGFFFIEAIFFFPADPLLILFCVERPRKSFYYATIATTASVLGGVAAYYIGMAVWATIGHILIDLFTSPENFQYLCDQYRLYQNWAVLIAGFTPIPFKAVTITAGFCRLPLLPFIVCSFIARGARFYLVAAVVHQWGKQIKKFIDDNFNTLVITFLFLVIVTVLILK
jgi:membrane protein YqaA with SNARE-associated domain